MLSVYEQFISPRLKVDITSLVYLFITFSYVLIPVQLGTERRSAAPTAVIDRLNSLRTGFKACVRIATCSEATEN